MARPDKRSVRLDKLASAPGDTKSEARQRAARLAQDQARARKRRLLVVQGVVGLVVVAVVVAITVVVLQRRDDGAATAVDSGSGSASSPGTPAEVDDDGGFTVGNPDAPVTVTMVEDFQCPICQQFEATNADLLSSYAAGDDVKLVYRGIAFLDKMSSTEYSTRALNASACVMPQGEDVWTTFHRTMYEQQPPEQGDGLTDDKVLDIATQAGADPDAITSCVKDERYADWVKDTTNKAFDDGVTGTPTIFVNDTKLSGFSAAEITTAVDKALGK